MTTNAQLIGFTGPPVSGKSVVIHSAAEWAATKNGKLAVACMPAAEADSYWHPAAETETFEDADWNPHYNSKVAGGFNELMRWLRGLEKRKDVLVVGLDTMTAASELAEHQACSTLNIMAMGDAEHGRGYTGTTDNLKSLMTQLKRLRRDFNKHILCAFHVSWKEMKGAGDPVEVKDMSSGKDAQGQKLSRVRWENRLLPMLSGVNDYASKVAGEFSLLCSTEVERKGAKVQGFLRILPDETGLQRSRAKLHAPPGETRAEAIWMNQIPNDFSTLMAMIQPEEAKA